MDKVFKVASYVFILILVIIISFTFGVPSFFSPSSDVDVFVAAEVNGNIISKKELSSALNNYKRSLGKGVEIPEQYLQQMKGQILNSLINQKLLFNTYQDSYLVPTEQQSKKELASFLRTNFSQFVSEKTGDFLFKKFQREILDKYSISLSDLAKDTLKGKAMETNRELLNSLQSISKADVYERLRLEDSWFSYQVFQFTEEKKKSFLKKRISISEREIKERFEKEYKKDAPDAKLTSLKRQDIRERIEKEKTALAEERWDTRFKKEIESNKPLTFFQSKYNGLLFTVKKVSPLESFSENASSKNTSIRSMDDVFEIKSASFSQKLNKTAGPFYATNGNVYVIRITSRKLSKLPSAVDSSFDNDKYLSNLNELQSLQFENLLAESREDNLENLFQSLSFYLIQHAKIERSNSL